MRANLTTAILLASGTLILAACDNSGEIEALQEQIDDARAELDEQPQGATPDSAPAADAAAENVPPAVPTASPPAAEAPILFNAQGYPLKTDARGHELVLIPPGTFTMGATLHEREVPPHQVTLTREYWLDVYEVSNAQYATCVDEGACLPPRDSSSNSRPSYYGDAAFASFPFIWVSWQDASSFCQWRDGRLPSEAEWEYAARGAAGADYPWGTTSRPARSLLASAGNTVVSIPSGSLINRGLEGNKYFQSRSAGVNLANFVVEAEFENPPLDDWTYGFAFRRNDDGEFWLTIDNQEYWTLNHYSPQVEWSSVSRGRLQSLDTDAGGANWLILVANGDFGYLFVNDQYVDDLDLSQHVSRGDLNIAINMRLGSGTPHVATVYNDFTVRWLH